LVAIQSPTRRLLRRFTRLIGIAEVVQGWVIDDPEALATLNLPAGESAVEIPDRMIQFFK
jgi:hypothetical protein